MRDGMRRSIGLALLLGILCAPPARAQDAAAPRPWSDPPTKPAEAPAVKEAAKPAASAAEHSAATPARTAATPARTASRSRKAERAERRAERRERVASRPIRRPVAEAPPRRVVAFRPAPEPRPVRVARPLPPDMPGYRDVDLWVDARADRIRRARDGGFLVMRRTTIEDPMGRRMHVLRPFDDEDE